jgi:hypothetical protein
VKILLLLISQLTLRCIQIWQLNDYVAVALNVLIFQNFKIANSFSSSSDEDGLTCLLDVVPVFCFVEDKKQLMVDTWWLVQQT